MSCKKSPPGIVVRSERSTANGVLLVWTRKQGAVKLGCLVQKGMYGRQEIAVAVELLKIRFTSSAH